MTLSSKSLVLLIVSQIRQWIRTSCQNASVLPLLLSLLLLLPETTKENGMGIPARDQLQFSHRFSSKRLTVIRVPVSTLQATRGRVDIGEFTQCGTNATDTTVVSATRDVARGASRWVTKPRIAGAHGLQIRIASSNSKHRKINNSNGATGDAFSVALKATLRRTVPSLTKIRTTTTTRETGTTMEVTMGEQQW